MAYTLRLHVRKRVVGIQEGYRIYNDEEGTLAIHLTDLVHPEGFTERNVSIMMFRST